MTTATDRQVFDSLERAIIGLSSGLQELDEASEDYQELKNKIDELFDQWRELSAKLNPCDVKIND